MFWKGFWHGCGFQNACHKRTRQLCKNLRKLWPCAQNQGSAFATSGKNRLKIDENFDVFWDIDFGGVLGGFRDGFGNRNPRFSLFFLYFFEVKFEGRVGQARDHETAAPNGKRDPKEPSVSLAQGPGGEDLGEGITTLSTLKNYNNRK